MNRTSAALGLYLRLFTWFTLRNLRSHMMRSLSVLLGIALGAAVFTSVRLAVHATVDSFSRSMDLIAGVADITLERPGGRLPDTLITPLLKHPSVEAASPVLSIYVRTPHSSEQFLLIGFDPILDRRLRSWRTQAGAQADPVDWSSLMTTPHAVFVGNRLADQFDWRPGQQILLSTSSGTAPVTVAGILDPEGLALVEGGRIMICDIATFQEMTGLFGEADRIDVRFKPDAPASVRTALKEVLPAGIVINAPSERKEAGKGMIVAYQYSLTFLSFISLFVGMFLVYSLVALNVAARKRELAVMRSTGATRRMLFYLFVGEGAFIGLLGWLIALPVSTLLVKVLIAAVSRTVSMLFVRVQVDQLALNPWEVLLSFGVTIAVAILAAFQPAREAMGTAPREALSVDPAAAIKRPVARKMALAGLGFLAPVWPVSQLPSLPSVSLPGYSAALLLFIGFALMAPLCLQALGRLLAPLLFRLGGPPAFLAAGYLRQSSIQTAISVGALITAVALFTALVIMIHSFRSTVALWVQQSIAGDLYIRPRLSELNRFRDPLPAPVVEAIRALEGPVERIPMRRLELLLNGRQHLFEAMDYAAYARRSTFIWMGGDEAQIKADLIAGRGVVVSEVFANTTGLGIGDRYRVQIGEAFLDAPILGIFRDYRTRGGAVYYSLPHYQEQFDDLAWSGVQLNFDDNGQRLPGVKDRSRAALLACCGDAIEMMEGEKLRQAILRIFDETFAITTVLLMIALAVAALGIATTLAVMVLQRSRQLNTIRAVGGSKSQLRSMILWEAAMIVVAGQAAGLACGFMLSYLLIFVVNLQSFGWTFLYGVDWPGLLTALPLIFAAALLAALPAVRMALNASPAVLLRGEAR
jgi:putative ABC transport system permease protein